MVHHWERMHLGLTSRTRGAGQPQGRIRQIQVQHDVDRSGGPRRSGTEITSQVRQSTAIAEGPNGRCVGRCITGGIVQYKGQRRIHTGVAQHKPRVGQGGHFHLLNGLIRSTTQALTRVIQGQRQANVLHTGCRRDLRRQSAPHPWQYCPIPGPCCRGTRTGRQIDHYGLLGTHRIQRDRTAGFLQDFHPTSNAVLATIGIGDDQIQAVGTRCQTRGPSEGLRHLRGLGHPCGCDLPFCGVCPWKGRTRAADDRGIPFAQRQWSIPLGKGQIVDLHRSERACGWALNPAKILGQGQTDRGSARGNGDPDQLADHPGRHRGPVKVPHRIDVWPPRGVDGHRDGGSKARWCQIEIHHWCRIQGDRLGDRCTAIPIGHLELHLVISSHQPRDGQQGSGSVGHLRAGGVKNGPGLGQRTARRRCGRGFQEQSRGGAPERRCHGCHRRLRNGDRSRPREHAISGRGRRGRIGDHQVVGVDPDGWGKVKCRRCCPDAAGCRLPIVGGKWRGRDASNGGRHQRDGQGRVAIVHGRRGDEEIGTFDHGDGKRGVCRATKGIGGTVRERVGPRVGRGNRNAVAIPEWIEARKAVCRRRRPRTAVTSSPHSGYKLDGFRGERVIEVQGPQKEEPIVPSNAIGERQFPRPVDRTSHQRIPISLDIVGILGNGGVVDATEQVRHGAHTSGGDPEVVVPHPFFLRRCIVIDRLTEPSPATCGIEHGHRIATRTGQRHGQVAEKTVLQVDQQALNVIRTAHHLPCRVAREGDGGGERLAGGVWQRDARSKIAGGRTGHRIRLCRCRQGQWTAFTNDGRHGGNPQGDGRRHPNLKVDAVEAGAAIVVFDRQRHVVHPADLIGDGGRRPEWSSSGISKIPVPTHPSGTIEKDRPPSIEVQRLARAGLHNRSGQAVDSGRSQWDLTGRGAFGKRKPIGSSGSPGCEAKCDAPRRIGLGQIVQVLPAQT